MKDDFDRVELVDVSRHYGRRRAVSHVSLGINRGEMRCDQQGIGGEWDDSRRKVERQEECCQERSPTSLGRTP